MDSGGGVYTTPIVPSPHLGSFCCTLGVGTVIKLYHETTIIYIFSSFIPSFGTSNIHSLKVSVSKQVEVQPKQTKTSECATLKS